MRNGWIVLALFGLIALSVPSLSVTTAAAVEAWMPSSGRRANLLSPNVTETGVGYVYLAGSPYGYYWVQECGSRPPETYQAIARFPIRFNVPHKAATRFRK